MDNKLVSVPALTDRGVLVQFKLSRAVLTSIEITVAVINSVRKLFAWNVKQDVVWRHTKTRARPKKMMKVDHRSRIDKHV